LQGTPLPKDAHEKKNIEGSATSSHLQEDRGKVYGWRFLCNALKAACWNMPGFAA
jgi:hypothetical protein